MKLKNYNYSFGGYLFLFKELKTTLSFDNKFHKVYIDV